MSEQIVADVPGQVYAYRDGALLVVVRGAQASAFGSAFEPIRRELVDRCVTLVLRKPNAPKDGQPAWADDGEISVYKVWAECPPYEHDCAELVAHVAS